MIISNKRINITMVPQEEWQKSEPTVKRSEIDNAQNSQYTIFEKVLNEKAYDRNETVVNTVRSSCKLELLQRSFKIY